MFHQNRKSSQQPGDVARSVVGSVSLFGGVAVLGLLLIDAVGGLPWRMPRSWYSDRPLWGGLSFLLIGVGWWLLRNRPPSPTIWRPTKPGQRFIQVTFYTRDGCHLCEDAWSLLEKYREYLPTVEEVDIDADRDLHKSFDTCVPVVEIDGKVRFRGKVDEFLLRRLIEGTPPRRE